MGRKRPRPSLSEALERRTSLTASIANVNVSQLLGNQAEGAISVDRADPSKMFAVSNIDVGDGLMVATSDDAGSTWNHRTIANDKDGLPAACCDPSADFDSSGNLFLTYLNSDTSAVVVLESTDAGQNFTLAAQFHGSTDQPTITTGPGSVWMDWDTSKGIAVAGATVSGLGQIGSFSTEQVVPGSTSGAFGDIAVGPSGQVMVTYQKPAGNASKIYVNIDPDGSGPAPFGKPVLASRTQTGDFDFISAQPNRGIDAEAGLAFDRSGGPFNGRAYLVYTDQTPGTENTDIFLRYSDTDGSSWSNPIRVNDDTTLTSQLLPRVAIDNTSGELAVGWYDARNDLGTGSAGNTDTLANDDVEYYAALVTPFSYGLGVSPNLQIAAAPSNADDAKSGIDLGDYTGLDFYQGTIHPLWFDNSNSTGNNPDGTLKDLDVYTANVPATDFPADSLVSAGGFNNAAGPVAALTFAGGASSGMVRNGASFTMTIQYSDALGINKSTLGGENLLVTGPGGFSRAAALLRTKSRKGGTIQATYKLTNPVGKFTPAEGGTYQILLEPRQVQDSQGYAATSGILGTFAVTTGGPGARITVKAPRHRGGDDDDSDR